MAPRLPSPPSRREFLSVSAALSSGILLGFRLSRATDAVAQAAPAGAAAEFAPNAFIRISKANVVTIVVNKAEMGQGISTALPMLIAEELEVDLRRVKVVAAPVDPAYAHPVFGMQMTGGSTSIASEWERYRKAGAAAREMLLAAAADVWKVDRASLRAENGTVIGPGGSGSPTGSWSSGPRPCRCRQTRRSRTRPSGSSSGRPRSGSTAG